MSSTREIVNSVFDWRSVGGIIMDYIETPKDEYKRQFDLVINELNSPDLFFRRWRSESMADERGESSKSCLRLRAFAFTHEEVKELIDAVYYYYESCYFNYQRAIVKGDYCGYENYINRPEVVLRRFAVWNKEENLLMFRFWSALTMFCGHRFFDYKFITIMDRMVRERNGLKDPHSKPTCDPEIVPKPCCTIM